MVHIYYHIYAIDGVESIIDEQLNLIKKYFNFPYKLNVGISIADENTSIVKILDMIDVSNLRDVRAKGHEFVTLDLIENDMKKFGDSDYILYLHTKGASKQNDPKYKNIITWRQVMNYFNIEKVKDVFKLFERSDFNTYGILYYGYFYSGNFWWMTSEYAKSIDLTNVKKNRFNAEIKFIQSGKNWKPYSPYNMDGVDNYSINFKREEYAK
jgi:hypothetical protein